MSDDKANPRVRDPNTPLSIVYTGAVYEANLDAFQNLVTAVSLSDFDLKVRIYTAQSDEALSAHGIRGPVEVHGHRPVGEARALQRDADVLFLPLAFASPYPKIIRTSSPAKMCEYLSSGTPILVHAPPNTFVAEHFREYGCGVVVDEPDPVLLASAVRQLLEDERLRTNVTRAALSRARADYDLNAARKTFAATVGF